MLDHPVPTPHVPNLPSDRGSTPASSAHTARTNGPPLRIALAHDWLVISRGGEQVLEAIAQCLSDQGHTLTAIYTMADNDASIGPVVDTLPRKTPPIGRIPGANGPLRRWMFPLYPTAVAQLSSMLAADHHAAPIDLLVSTSSAAIKSLRPPAGVPHLCYCHSPARYAWSQRADYATGSLLRRTGLALYAPIFQQWDRATASHVSRFLANSSHIANRIQSCYGRSAQVLHPPVRTDFYCPDPNAPREPWLLVVCALEPYKRVDAAIEAAHAARRPLRIAGTGSDERRLRSLAHGKDVTFMGRVDDPTLRDLYRKAHALLYPQVEDFGITAVEAQACGTPVVALAQGGALDTVIDHQTGVLVPRLQDFPSAISRCPHNPQACRNNALRFSHEQFRAGFTAAINALPSRQSATV